MAIAGSTQTERPSERLRVLIVEDTPSVAAMIQAGLHVAGMTTELAQTGNEAIDRYLTFKPDVVLLDLNLPDVDGLSLVQRFAAEGECGVIVVTASGEEATRVAGLDTGADDYVVKPVRLRELAARIRALHRRLHHPAEPRPGIITVDHARRVMLSPGGVRSVLTEAELSALETLLDAQGASVSREWLSKVALKRPLHSEDRSVDQLVLKLRRKLIEQGASARTILSVRRQGYVISDSTMFRSAPLPAMLAPGIEEE